MAEPPPEGRLRGSGTADPRVLKAIALKRAVRVGVAELIARHNQPSSQPRLSSPNLIPSRYFSTSTRATFT